MVKPEEKNKIQNGTRNIAALAARRRSKALAESSVVDSSRPGLPDGVLNRTYTSLQVDTDKRTELETGLTQSRLAQHDRKYASTMNLRHLAQNDDSGSTTEHQSLVTDVQTSKRRALYRNTARKTGAVDVGKQSQGMEAATSVAPPKNKTKNVAHAAYQQVRTTNSFSLCIVTVAWHNQSINQISIAPISPA